MGMRMGMNKIFAVLLALLLAGGAGGGVGMYHESEAIYTRERHTLEVAPSAGVDATTSPPDIKGGRASEMCNLICENGAVRKRCGWRQVAQVYRRIGNARRTGRVNGIWHFDDGEASCLIVHAGDTFYRVTVGTGWRTWSWTPIATLPEVEDRPSYGFQMGGKLWIVGAGGFFCYYKPDGSSGYSLTRVRDMAELYIPLTTHGIPHSGAEVGERQELDPVNLLTAMRQNGCVGVEFPQNVVDLGTNEPIYADRLIFRLDGTAVLHGDVTVKITVAEEGDGGIREVEYELVAVNQYYLELDPVAGTGEHIAYQVLMPRGWQYDNGVYKKDGVTAEGVCGYLHNSTGLLELFGCGVNADGTLIKNLASPVADTDNIFVTFEAAGGDRASLLDSAGFGILFGEEGTVDRLLLAGFPEERSMVYYSAPGDPSYFPADCYMSVGSDAARTLGFSRVSDGTLAIHKEGRGQEPVTYYLTMQADADEGTLTYRAIPSIVAGNLSEPLLAVGSLCDFYGDPLLLTSRGVMAVAMRQNLNTTERQMQERSRSIRTRLVSMGREALCEARGVAFGGRYYLAFPGGDCYVADGGATYRDEAGVTQYEWYPWQGVPATAWAVVEDVLYFGTPDGRICRMTEPHDRVEGGSLWADRRFTAFGTGEVTYNPATGRLTYAPQVLALRVGDKVRFDHGIYEPLLEAGGVSASAGVFTAWDDTVCGRIFDGLRLVADGDVAGSGLAAGAVYTVTAYDAAWKTFNLADEAGAIVAATFGTEADIRLLVALEGEELIVSEVSPAASYVRLKRYEEDEEPLNLTLLAGEGTASRALLGEAIYDEPVAASWYSGVYDLGDARRHKTLHMLTVSAKPGGGRIVVGYETRHAAEDVQGGGDGGLDFGSLDFNDFELSGFMSSYTARLRERRVNFLRFRFTSSTPTPCCLHNITVTYSYTGIIRGGR